MTDGPTNPVGVYHSPLVENGNPGRETNEGDLRNAGHRVGDVPAQREREELERAISKTTGEIISPKKVFHVFSNVSDPKAGNTRITEN